MGIFDPGIFDSGIFDESGAGVTAADSIATLSESPTRVATYVRSAGDSVSSITESVAGTTDIPGIFDTGIFDSGIFDESGGAISRTAADSLSTLTESPTRVATYARTASASLATLTEAVVGIRTLSRTVADSVSTLTEAVVATVAAAIVRTVADSLATLTEAVTQVRTINRTVADSISSISTAVTRVGTFLRAVAELVPIVNERVSVVVPYVPADPFTPGGLSEFDLTIGGLSVLTDSVVIASMHFESQVNGVAGQCKFRVRDDASTESFTVGQEIVLTIGGRTEWRGFIASVNRIYVFPALNVDDFGPTRFFDIVGSDINILLAKRIVFDQANGAHIMAPLLPPHTADVTAIQQLFADWLDLSGDGLDTTTYVENVADTTWTQEGRAWEGSDTWGQAMQSIASLPAAIYYIDPDKNFVYTDVDTPNAPFALSDQPNHVTSFGYREMEILLDGTNLANDVMCWGVGYGSQTPVFVRDTDATSQATHGLWQMGQTSFGVYLQSTINRIAASIIDGSPQSKRGAKNDRPAVMVTTYQQGLRVADKVNFTSNTFGFNDVIPIRKMEIDFEAPTAPKYTLTLSHEIDTPFNFFDPFMFNFHFPPFGFPPFNFPLPQPTPAGCQDCELTTLFDSFERTMPTGWGNAFPGFGLAYSTSILNGTWSVNGTQGIVVVDAGTLKIVGVQSTPPSISPFISGPWMDTTGWTLSTTFTMTEAAALGVMTIGVRDVIFSTYSVFARLDYAGQVLQDQDGTAYPMTLTSGVAYDIKLYVNWTGTAASKQWRVKAWEHGTTEPDWLIYGAGGSGYINTNGALFTSVTNSNPSATATGAWGQIDFTRDRCADIQFENFNRTVPAGSWGTTTPSGHQWQVTATRLSVNGSQGVFTLSGSSSALQSTTNWVEFFGSDAPAAPFYGGAFSMRTSFIASALGNGAISEFLSQMFTIYGGGSFVAGPQVECYISSAGFGRVSVWTQDTSTQHDQAFTWTTDLYNMRWDVLPGSYSRVKVWRAAEVEPTPWLIDADDTGGTVLAGNDTEFDVELHGRGTAGRTLAIDFIDFDYAVRPCYLACDGPTDTYTRTVAAGGWGTSDYGTAWTVGSRGSMASVNGTEGRLLPTSVSGTSFTSQILVLPFTYPIHLRALIKIVGASQTGSIQFWMSAVSRESGASGTPGSTAATFHYTSGGSPNVIDLGVVNARAGGGGSSGGTTFPLGTTDPADQWFWVEILMTSTDYKIRAYYENDAAPAYTDYPNFGGSPITVPALLEITAFTTNPATPDWRIEVLDIDGFPGCSTPIPAGSGVSLNAWVCEDFDPATTSLQMSASFVQYSAQVFLNGLLQPASAYTEDGGLGTIVFDTPPTGVARVCYWSLYLIAG